MAGTLAGRRIVVPESRELDLFAGMLERQGATTLRCPLVTILDVADPAPVEAWLRRLIAGELDDVVLFTGEGLRRLMGVADRAGFAAEAATALGQVRTVVRGPKPVKALREIGLQPGLVAAEPTSEGVMATLAGIDLARRRVGLQAYPGQGDAVDRFVESRGASVERVLPYRYAADEEDAAVAATIAAMGRGSIDAIAFTSRPQVDRLREVAGRRGLESALGEAMARTRVAAIGPVVARAIEKAGWRVDVQPSDSFHMKPMIVALARLFAAEGVD